MKYKAPLLATFLQVMSALAFVAAAASLAFCLDDKTRLHGFASLASFGILAALCFFVSQFVDVIARAAFDIGRIADRVAGNKPQESTSARDAVAPKQSTSETQRTTFYIARDGKTQGPISGAMVRQLIESGAVTSDTPAMRKGDSEWQTVAAILGSN